jgi:DNA polymerase III sliding clamp (beta) subunit (PCNA family)
MILDTQTAKNVIDNVFSAVKTNHPQEILQNLHIIQKEGRLYITGSNNIFQITGSVPIDKEEEVEVLVDAQVFSRSVQNASSDEIEVKFNEKSVTIKDDRSRSKISLTPNNGFPFIKFDQAKESMRADARGLAHAMKICKISALDPSTAMLDKAAGVTVKTQEGEAQVHSTNGSFIVQKASVKLKEGEITPVIIPKNAVDAIVGTLAETDEAQVEVGRSVQFKGGGYTVRVMPVNQSALNTDQFFPPDEGEDHWVDTTTFHQLVKRAKTQQRNNQVVTVNFEQSLEVGTLKDEVSEFIGEMQYEGKVSEKYFGLETNSLSDLLQYIDTTKCLIRTGTEHKDKVYLMPNTDQPHHIAVLSKTEPKHL